VEGSRIAIDRERLAGFCRRNHIRRLALFGSVLPEDFRPDSDAVLVEFEAGHVPGLRFFALERKLSEILGRKVDLNTLGFLSPYFRRRVLARLRSSMSRHEGDIRLRHMLDHAREAVAMASGRTRVELDTDRQLNLSLVRRLKIVGEAEQAACRRKNAPVISIFRGRRSSV
jgi:predicted nucleotidyltransferase